MSDFFGVIVGIFLSALYTFGIYEIIVDDHRYTTKDLVVGIVAFPYPIWVGGNTVYRFITTTSEDIEVNVKCLDVSEAMSMPRNSRLRFCECFMETKDIEACMLKVFNKKIVKDETNIL